MVAGDALRQAVSEPSVAEQLQSLLPETGEDPVAIVSSPQFHQVNRIELFMSGSFVESGQLGPLMSQFGLGQQTVQAANQGGKFIILMLVIGLMTYASQTQWHSQQLYRMK